MTEETKKVLEIGEAIRKGIQDGLKSRGIGMTEEEAKRIILDDPEGNIVKRMEAIAVARSILGEDCTMEEVWKWAEGNVKEVTARVKTCFECTAYVDIDTAYVDIDGDYPRCGLGRDPLKCDRLAHLCDIHAADAGGIVI